MPVVPRLRFAGRLSKSDSTPEECQDNLKCCSGRFAVSDGASDAAYSHIWSEILVEEFCDSTKGPLAEINATWLAKCRDKWELAEKAIKERSLPWFTREKLRAGSFATFLGLSFEPDYSGKWRADACGDSCLFVLADGAPKVSFPLTSHEEFGTTPSLLWTRHAGLPRAMTCSTGTTVARDLVLMATDALAEWLLTPSPSSPSRWSRVAGITTNEDLRALVTHAREAHDLKDDDVTLVSIEMIDVDP